MFHLALDLTLYVKEHYQIGLSPIKRDVRSSQLEEPEHSTREESWGHITVEAVRGGTIVLCKSLESHQRFFGRTWLPISGSIPAWLDVAMAVEEVLASCEKPDDM